MTRINSNVSSMLAQRVVGYQSASLAKSLERLSTGLAINRGADNPAGLIASESLRSEKAAISAAIGNAQRADQVLNLAEGSLQEINTLLVELQSLVGQSANEAGVSDSEKEANQLQIDSILQSIDRIANTASFNGTKLLNGNFDYTTTGVSADLNDVTINAARLPDSAGATLDVTVDVVASAQTSEIYLSTAALLNNGGNGSITFEITGQNGVQQFTFASGSSQANIINAINTFTEALGVSAAQSSIDTDRVEIRSTSFGSDAFVRVKILEGTTNNLLASAAGAGTLFTDYKDFGRNATVLINGNQAIANGLDARVSTDGFDISLSLDGNSALNDAGQSTSFTITGGGADFSLAPTVDLAGKVSLGIETVTTGNLGTDTEGFLSALKSGGAANVQNGDLGQAQRIVDAAIDQVTGLRGRLGAFQKNTIGSAINSLGIALENTTVAESTIRDTDFAAETATLTRQQIITQVALQALTIANAQPQSVLQLLG